MQSQKVTAREYIFQRLEEAYLLTQEFDYLCPRGCRACEENEGIVLLPYEHLFIRSKARSLGMEYIPSFMYHWILVCQKHLYIGYQNICTTCGALKGKDCAIYQVRPLDCRSFPVVPIFSTNDTIEFQFSAYCPISQKLPPRFISTIENIWISLLPSLPKNWRELYNEVSFEIGAR